ncbi:hypothetical protein AWU67_09370 [Microterricola viridarii]|uniref:Uncharacterized protein n=1 Tax=Microterricola viridarii TaxID=412690 RepID=A0A0Y0P868_9MICO|nr:hypothetical protein AWU67_09370 [Microterricola viridarii]
MLAVIGRALAEAVQSLRRADAATEALARFEPPRRRALLFTREAQMVPIGRVWRLGVFLLGTDGTLYATGHTTRAVDPRHPGYQSVSAEERRGFRAAAFRGPFERGETVNFDAEPILLDAEVLRSSVGALVLRDDSALVRWSPTAPDDALRPFAGYLAERVGLLLDRSA